MYMRTLACYVLTSFVKVRQALPKLVRTGYESIPYDVRPGKVLWLVTVVRPLDLNVKHQLGNLWATPTFSNLDIVLTLCFSSVYFSVPFSFSVMHSMSVAIYQIIDRIFVMIKKKWFSAQNTVWYVTVRKMIYVNFPTSCSSKFDGACWNYLPKQQLLNLISIHRIGDWSLHTIRLRPFHKVPGHSECSSCFT